MRHIVIAAIGVAVLSGCASNQKNAVQLSESDPKYNTAACKAIRDKHYDDGTLEEQAARRVLGAAMWGGGFAVTMAQRRKREYVDREVEQACMSNPPDRSYLNENVTNGR